MERKKGLSVVKVLREIPSPVGSSFFARKSRRKVIVSLESHNFWPNLLLFWKQHHVLNTTEASSASQEFSIKNPIECENGKEKEPQTCSFATSFRG